MPCQSRARERSFQGRIRLALQRNLADVGIKAEVDSVPVVGTRMRRFVVVAPKFRHMRFGERQEYIWRLLKAAVCKSDTDRISMILTVTPAERSMLPAMG